MKDSLIRDDRVAAASRKFAAADGHPIVEAAYPRHGVWSGNNQLGVELPFDPNIAHPMTVLKMDEWGFPNTWTVSLGVRFDRELLAGEAFDCVGQINFGSGGITQSFDVDWVDGTVISLPMNAVNVLARWNDIAALAGIGVPNAGVKVSVILGQYAMKTRATLTRFFSAGTTAPPAAGTSAITKVPAFGKSFQLLPLAAADQPLLYGANVFLEFLANTQPTSTIASISGSFLGPNVKVPIPAFARYWRIRQAGTAQVQGSAICNLFEE